MSRSIHGRSINLLAAAWLCVLVVAGCGGGGGGTGATGALAATGATGAVSAAGATGALSAPGETTGAVSATGETGTMSATRSASDSGSGTGNVAPVAAVSTSSGAQAPVNLAVTFDGTGSADADGDALSFRWTLASRPAGSAAALDASAGPTVNLTPDVPGDFVVTLVVNDGKVDSSATSATLHAVNVAPVANAGFDRSLQIGETGVLDGSASSDLNGDALTYKWSVIAGPSGSQLIGDTQALAQFVPSVAGVYTLGLVVNDGALDSAQATVRLTAVAIGLNRAPTADAGIDQNVPLGTVVTLDGSASSDPDGNSITYAWTLDSKPANSTAAIVDATSPRPSLTPDQAGTYIASLVVTDSSSATSVADQVVVTVNPLNKNNAPVAVAGPAQNVLVGATVELDGSGSSDADGDLLSYSWSITSKPAGSAAQLSFIDAYDPAPTFMADMPGVYVIGLVVGDGKTYSTQASVTVTAAPGNVAPVANAGDDVSTVVLNTVSLSGALSSDANAGDTLTYAWTLVSSPTGSAAVPGNTSNVTATLTPDVPGIYVVQLVVTDNHGLWSAPDNVVVTAGAAGVNLAPVAKAGPRQRSAIGQTVTLNGSKSYDPNGTSITYAWKFKSKPKKSTATLIGSTTVAPTFVPDVRGNYVVQLVVSDGQLTSVASSVMIQVRR
ncbi:PKD domain-containing protein [Variovorax sp. YR216]|uniref:PKD domain-containing protein n=1 Tax=Variovorax sp. YR216 TaxID=1882828 RepID=UPI00089BF5BE|nr:PKD domain-containing protein [Variovorax sp. YR216]SEB25203.1 PKD domain-containing protein [Variovorax sp. YR216]